ncbi:hypothetical protein [Polaromonas sp. SM01]|uniref:hypothetical protein n=1 Tax=Polaromonas sp. SM01 TaxID=3085630 RepID=UPI002981F1E7|nr:hypothetical protein [Polaromonas sp. SM01]MDW5442890.1 hypothetical protein [Polaromonas sp. SM01]
MALLCLVQLAQAQSSCASDGQPVPTALVERFINADCADCWTDPATPRLRRGELALDWVTPGDLGEDAPLSAVANRDALARLQVLGHKVPPTHWTSTSPVATRQAGVLRVAHGLPLSGYVGASIELKALPRQAGSPPWSAWLALVETLPAGTEGSPVTRNLVKNLLQPHWDGREQLLKNEQIRFEDSRAMNIPPGMNTDRLRLIGWVQDAKGRIVAAAQSRCRQP